MSFISNNFILIYLIAIPTAKKCQSVEQLTDSAIYISPYFLDYLTL